MSEQLREIALVAIGGWPSWWRPLLGVGLPSRHMTFSALSLEAAELILTGRVTVAALYLGLSGIAVLVGALSGLMIGRAIV